MRTEDKIIWIECECGNHALRVSTESELFQTETDNLVATQTLVHQTYYLAMFSNGENKPDSFIKRIKIIWNYLKTGKMHKDQMLMTPDEAYKLSKFIIDEMIPTK